MDKQIMDYENRSFCFGTDLCLTINHSMHSPQPKG